MGATMRKTKLDANEEGPITMLNEDTTTKLDANKEGPITMLNEDTTTKLDANKEGPITMLNEYTLLLIFSYLSVVDKFNAMR